ncbi:MAG: non-ribosomal peptide synthetase, partial [Caldimonas sp.]
RETGVTTMWLTASLFNLVIDQDPGALAGVEEVLTGGEALSVSHVRRAQLLLPGVQLINGYGPTESTTFACCYRIPPALPAGIASIPIGPPIANTTIRLMDPDLRASLPGEVGDLYIGGDGLAIGYLNRADLTAERFIVVRDGERLYKTGDRARLLADGSFEFLGRIDDQVKIRGHRVELGEIESALRMHPAVGDAVVTLREDAPGDKRLAAYYTGLPAPVELTAAVLRQFLAERLPEYMVPSHFVPLRDLPLTPNGKADRHSLPAPGRQRPALERPMLAPRNAVEAWVAGHWRELLALEEIGVHDRFFELGGTSLTAIRLLARLSQDTRTPLPTLLLFRAPTIAEMASILETEYGDLLPPSLVRPAVAAAPSGAQPWAQAAISREQGALHERRMRRRLADR